MIERFFFTAEWCPTCKSTWPSIIARADRNNSRIRKIDVETDEGRELVTKFDVLALPTLVITKGGVVDGVPLIGSSVLRWNGK